MALNESITPATQLRVPVPSTVDRDPLVIGNVASDPLKGLACVAVTSYDSRDGMATLQFDGSHNLTVSFQSGCPQVSAATIPASHSMPRSMRPARCTTPRRRSGAVSNSIPITAASHSGTTGSDSIGGERLSGRPRKAQIWRR